MGDKKYFWELYFTSDRSIGTFIRKYHPILDEDKPTGEFTLEETGRLTDLLKQVSPPAFNRDWREAFLQLRQYEKNVKQYYHEVWKTNF